MKKITQYYIITVLFAGFAFYTGKIIIDYGNGYKHEMNSVAETLNFENRLTNPKEWLLPKHAWEKLSERYERIAERAKTEYEEINRWVVTFVMTSVMYIIIVLLLYVRTPLFYRKASLSLGFLSFMLLYVGLFCPMIEISALQDNLHVPIVLDIPLYGNLDLSRNFEGRMIYFYQNKSVADVISLLFTNKNYVVGFCILLFSVIFPVTKLICTILSVYSKRLRHNKVVYFVVHYLGKWSMADVFVAACFLAFLSFANMNAGVDNESDVLHGMYFFLAFVVCSLLSSTCLKMHARKLSNAVAAPVTNQTWTLSH